MNLLKLPPFDTEEAMREKLLYAISSNVGFDLS
jgi:ubiquitin-protein ligase E3 C